MNCIVLTADRVQQEEILTVSLYYYVNMLDLFICFPLNTCLVHFQMNYFVDTTSVQALLNSSMTYDFNDFNFQFTLKIKPEFENQIQKVNVGGSQVPTWHNCNAKTTPQVPSTSGDAKNK